MVEADEKRTSGRAMPSNVDAERAILSAILRDNNVFDDVVRSLKGEDFYLESHRIIYEALGRLAEESKAFDAITLAEELHHDAALERVGGPAYIGDLIDYVGSTVAVNNHMQIVREKAMLRRMIRAATEIAVEGYEEGLSVRRYLDESERRIFEVLSPELRGQAVPIREVLKTTIDKLESLNASESGVTGITTGFRDLDQMLLGLHNSDLVIVAARPSMGKTAFAMNIATNIAVKANKAVAVFSLEMSSEQLAIRLLSSQSRVELTKLRAGALGDHDWRRLVESLTNLSKAPIYVDDTPALSLMELRAKARRLHREGHCDAIFVDYLQLMRSGKDLTSREQEISEISRGLKSLAKELDVPVVALSQLNRSLEQRGDKRPILSDLRESGAIEQDADVILFIYRDKVYNKDSEAGDKSEILIRKQRNGPTGDVVLHFSGPFTRFDNYQHEQ